MREIDGQILRERTPVCRPCPENTYQDRPGGEECLSCPENHVTSSNGAKSRDECIGMFICIQ